MHRYLYNLQFGIDSMQHKQVQRHQGYTCLLLPYRQRQLPVYVNRIQKPAWSTEDPKDYPLLLTDGGQTAKAFRGSHFSPKLLLAWQLDASFKFHNLIDLQPSAKIQRKYGVMSQGSGVNLVCVTSHKHFAKQLCIFVAFLMTAQDLCHYYLKK